MVHVGVLVLGVADVPRAAAFWSAALGYELRTDGFGGWATVLVPVDSSGPAIALQHSATPPQDHPRLHLDLHVSGAGEQAAETERLLSLGARRVEWDSYPDDPDFVVLADPDDNRFASWTSTTTCTNQPVPHRNDGPLRPGAAMPASNAVSAWVLDVGTSS